tara:strand:+ start:121 stop:732 length:612 start_codon:yes stop_codon:yes gene_type:complete
MRLKITPNYSVNTLRNGHPSPKEYAYVMAAAACKGVELDVDTDYIFPASFNAVIPAHKKEFLIETIVGVVAPSVRNLSLTKDDADNMVNKSAIFHVPLGIVSIIINDIRVLYKRCNYTGKKILLSECDNYEKKEYLESLNFPCISQFRLWRLEDIYGKKIELKDDELIKLTKTSSIEEAASLLSYQFGEEGVSSEYRFNDEPA